MLQWTALPRHLDVAAAFDSLGEWSHRMWFDSSGDQTFPRGRFSFLTADPVAWFRVDLDGPDPWPALRSACQAMAATGIRGDAETAPFCGGLAGVIGYESAWWLEPSLRSFSQKHTDAPEEPLGAAIGLYDWAIAVDHWSGDSKLWTNGLTADFGIDAAASERRRDAVMGRLANMRPVKLVPFSISKHVAPESSLSADAYTAAVDQIVAGIRAGDCFQVNLAHTLTLPANEPVDVMVHRLRAANPAPAAGFYDLGDRQVLSSSPEGFLQVRDRGVLTRPIKGTVPRTGDAATDEMYRQKLAASEKDRAENIMIVDLMRNDLSRVCDDDSVLVTGVCEIESYSRVQHLVSTVEGRLRADMTVADLVAACFPGGSITGAPKVEAMKTIAMLERRPRNAYCGSAGYISVTGQADFNILIRTMTARDGSWTLPVGGGITARSEPESEYEETWTKARAMLDAFLVDPQRAIT